MIALDRQPIQLEHANLTKVELDLADATGLKAWLSQNTALLVQVDIFLSTAGVLDAFQPALAVGREALFMRVMQINTVCPNSNHDGFVTNVT